MSWVAVGVAAVSVVGGAVSANKQAKAGEKAAGAQQDASAASLAEQQRQFDINQQNQQPWLQAGQGALNQINALNSGDFSSFTASPDYQFTYDQGMLGLDRAAAARGGLYSGGADADRIALGQGLASQQYGNFYNRLAGVAGVGQAAANQLGAYGQNFGQQYAQQQGNIGDARASAYANTANAWSNFGQQATGALGMAAGIYGQRAQTPTTGYGAFAPAAGTGASQPYMGNSAFGAYGSGWGG